MNISYDSQADAMYIHFAKGKISESREVLPGIILDIGRKEKLLGIEILDVRSRYSKEAIAHIELDILPKET